MRRSARVGLQLALLAMLTATGGVPQDRRVRRLRGNQRGVIAPPAFTNWSSVTGGPFATVSTLTNGGATYNGLNASVEAIAAIPTSNPGGATLFWLNDGNGIHGVTTATGCTFPNTNNITIEFADGAVVQAQAVMTTGIFNNSFQTQYHYFLNVSLDQNSYAAYGWYWVTSAGETSNPSVWVGCQVKCGDGTTNGNVANVAGWQIGAYEVAQGYEDSVLIACTARGSTHTGLSFNIQVAFGEASLFQPKCYGKPIVLNGVGGYVVGSSIVAPLIGVGNSVSHNAAAGGGATGSISDNVWVFEGVQFTDTQGYGIGSGPWNLGSVPGPILGTIATLTGSGGGGSILAGDTSLTNNTFANVPASLQVYLQFTDGTGEIILLTSGNGTNTWTVARGQVGTTAAAHAASTAVNWVIPLSNLPCFWHGVYDPVNARAGPSAGPVFIGCFFYPNGTNYWTPGTTNPTYGGPGANSGSIFFNVCLQDNVYSAIGNGPTLHFIGGEMRAQQNNTGQSTATNKLYLANVQGGSKGTIVWGGLRLFIQTSFSTNAAACTDIVLGTGATLQQVDAPAVDGSTFASGNDSRYVTIGQNLQNVTIANNTPWRNRTGQTAHVMAQITRSASGATIAVTIGYTSGGTDILSATYTMSETSGVGLLHFTVPAACWLTINVTTGTFTSAKVVV